MPFITLCQLLATLSSIILTAYDLCESNLEVELLSDESHDYSRFGFSAARYVYSVRLGRQHL